MSTVDPVAFRRTLGSFLTGVTVVSAVRDARVHGMTASAFLSVSLEPPLVLVSVQKTAHMHAHLADAGAFAVSVLPEGTEVISNHFAGRPDPGLELRWQHEGVVTPVLADALAWVDCTLEQAIPAGDHTLFLGRVRGLGWREGRPLAYFRGRYERLA